MHITDKHRFELLLAERAAVLEYTLRDNVMSLTRTYVHC